MRRCAMVVSRDRRELTLLAMGGEDDGCDGSYYQRRAAFKLRELERSSAGLRG